MDFFEDKIKYPLRKLITGLRNLGTWFSVIWKDRDWDYSFMLDIERKKIRNMIKWYEENDYGHHVNGWHDYRTMKLALSCLDIILESDWWRIDVPNDINWLTNDFRDDYYKIDAYINLNNYKRFFPKLKEEQVNNHKRLYSIHLREAKAWHLYHRIREQYMRDWWD